MHVLSSPILIVSLAVLCGASIDAAVKYVALGVPVLTIMGWRFLIAGAVLLAVYVYLGKPVPKWAAIRFHAMRGIVQAVAAISFFWSLTQLALAEATVIGFTAALMIAPVARIILGEAISTVAGAATLIGFAGAMLAASGQTEGAPADGDRVMGVIVCLIAAFSYALTLVLMRLRTRQEDTLTIVMFTNVMTGLVLLPFLMATDPVPAPAMLPVYAGFAAAGTLVWWLMTIGYSRAEAQTLAPLEYAALVWASLYGWWLFGETPGWQLWLGALVIIAACLIVAFETRFRTRRETHMPASDIPE